MNLKRLSLYPLLWTSDLESQETVSLTFLANLRSWNSKDCPFNLPYGLFTALCFAEYINVSCLPETFSRTKMKYNKCTVQCIVYNNNVSTMYNCPLKGNDIFLAPVFILKIKKNKPNLTHYTKVKFWNMWSYDDFKLLKSASNYSNCKVIQNYTYFWIQRVIYFAEANFVMNVNFS